MIGEEMIIRAQTVICGLGVIKWFVERRQDWHLCAKYFHPSCALTCSCNVWVLVKWEFLLTRNNFMQIVRTGEVNLQLTVTFCLAYISSNRAYVNFIYCLFLLHCFSVFKDLKKEKKAYSAFMLVNHFSSTFWSYSYLKIFMWGKKKNFKLCAFLRGMTTLWE